SLRRPGCRWPAGGPGWHADSRLPRRRRGLLRDGLRLLGGHCAGVKKPASGVPRPAAVTARAVRRSQGGRLAKPVLDAIAVEEPLEIRLGGRTLAVTMRTPGLEREKVPGTMPSEGPIASAA